MDFYQVLCDFDNALTMFPFVLILALAISGWALIFTPSRIRKAGQESPDLWIETEVDKSRVKNVWKKSGITALALIIGSIIGSALRLGWAHPGGGSPLAMIFGYGDEYAANILVPSLIFLAGSCLPNLDIWSVLLIARGKPAMRRSVLNSRTRFLGCILITGGLAILLLLILIEPVRWDEVTVDSAGLIAFLGIFDVFAANAGILMAYN